MKFFTTALLLASLSSIALSANAQNNDTLEIKRNAKGNVTFARFSPSMNAKIREGDEFLHVVLRTKTNDELRLNKDTVDKLGMTHRIYQQYYKGVKVENGEFLIHGKNLIIETINGDFQEVNLSSVVPQTHSTDRHTKCICRRVAMSQGYGGMRPITIDAQSSRRQTAHLVFTNESKEAAMNTRPTALHAAAA